MKTGKFLLLIAFLFTGAVALAQDFDNPAKYNEYINKMLDNVSKKYLSYNSAMAHGKNGRKIDKQRTKLMDEVQESRMNISGLPSYNGDKAFRDSAVSFLKLYFNVLNEDYSKIVNMEEIAEQSYDLMEAYLLAQEKVDEKMQEASGKMQQAQKNFAALNNMTLTTNSNDELSLMMKEVGETNEYYHKAYLIFFKSNKQDLYLMEAVQKGDLNAIEQNKNALISTSKEGIDKITALGAFKGDNSLVSACKALLTFYSKVANEKVTGMTDFYLKKDKFETLKKEMDKKNNRTQQDIDAYNKAVNDFNAAAGVFNNVNKAVAENHNDLLKDWDQAVNSFMAEHTPKYKN